MMALLLLCGSSYAGTDVKFDFDANGKDLFGLPGESSNDANDGDFTEAKTAIIDGVSITVSPAAEGVSNANRIWNKSPKLRMYSGTLIVAAPTGHKITGMTFNQGKWNNGNLVDKGTLSSEGWEGSEPLVVIVIAGNTQFKDITVTLDGDSGTDPGNPSNVNNLLSIFDFSSGTITDNGNQVVLDFAGVAKINAAGQNNIDVSGKFLFDFENDFCTACTAILTFPNEIVAILAETDAKANAEKDGYASVTRDGSTLTIVSSRDFLGYSRIFIKSMIKMLIDNEQGGLGILDSPMSPNQANGFAGSLEKDKVSDQDIFIKGKIASIKFEFSAQYGTATFFISADGKDEFTFQCYSVNYLENKPWVDGNTQIKVGDEVIICGKVVNYKGNTPETSSKKAYIYSLNGKTKEEGGTNPDPQVTTATCAEILAGTDGTVYRVTGKCVEIANTTYGNWYLEDATGKVYIYGTLDAEGNTKNFASLGIEVGDEITVEGPRKTYKETVELVDVKVIAIKKGSSSEGGLIYSWEGGADGATEVGGKATYENGETDETKYRVNYKNGEYYTICINGKKGNINDEAGSANGGYILITLDQELKADDAIELTGYITKNESKQASIYFLFEKGDGVDDEYIFGDGDNIDSTIGGKISTHVFKVPAASDGSKSFKMSRNKAGTNVFLTKLTINRGTTGIKEIKNVQLQNNAVYNLAGQKVGNDYKGIVIVNGKKFMQK